MECGLHIGADGRAASFAWMGTDSQAWLVALRGPVGPREQALGELRALLSEAARFELGRHRSVLDHLTDGEVERLARGAADAALEAIVRRLDAYRGVSRFTTWAYKFVLLEAAVAARRAAWDAHGSPDGPSSPPADVALAMRRALTPQQRAVVQALVFDGVPIDVLAQQTHTTRPRLYATLHAARRDLRAHLGVAQAAALSPT
jgi:RNA polymerase sigma-70 factor (ECF subfamily)